MRFAYADPPYPGLARKHYRDHADFAGEVDHARLIEELEGGGHDGWALSTSCQALPEVLGHCPTGRGEVEGVRVCAWHKPTSPHYPGVLTYSWEPMILRGGRRPLPTSGVAVLDALVASPEAYGAHKATDPAHVTGQKPGQFWRWLFAVFGALPGDDFVDLFPGSGQGAREWRRFIEQPSLLAIRPEPAKNARRRVRKTHPELGEGAKAATDSGGRAATVADSLAEPRWEAA